MTVLSQSQVFHFSRKEKKSDMDSIHGHVLNNNIKLMFESGTIYNVLKSLFKPKDQITSDFVNEQFTFQSGNCMQFNSSLLKKQLIGCIAILFKFLIQCCPWLPEAVSQQDGECLVKWNRNGWSSWFPALYYIWLCSWSRWG